MRRVRFRKNTIFAIYLAVLLLLCVGGVVWALTFQARYHSRRVEDLTIRLADVEARLAERSSSSSSVSPTSSDTRLATPIQKAVAAEAEKIFWVRGNGFNRLWAYMDIEFKDGYWARYYFRPFPSRGEIVSLHRRITHDAVLHYADPLLDSEL